MKKKKFDVMKLLILFSVIFVYISTTFGGQDTVVFILVVIMVFCSDVASTVGKIHKHMIERE
jgi:dolichol kinase